MMTNPNIKMETKKIQDSLKEERRKLKYFVKNIKNVENEIFNSEQISSKSNEKMLLKFVNDCRNIRKQFDNIKTEFKIRDSTDRRETEKKSKIKEEKKQKGSTESNQPSVSLQLSAEDGHSKKHNVKNDKSFRATHSSENIPPGDAKKTNSVLKKTDSGHILPISNVSNGAKKPKLKNDKDEKSKKNKVKDNKSTDRPVGNKTYSSEKIQEDVKKTDSVLSKTDTGHSLPMSNDTNSDKKKKNLKNNSKVSTLKNNSNNDNGTGFDLNLGNSKIKIANVRKKKKLENKCKNACAPMSPVRHLSDDSPSNDNTCALETVRLKIKSSAGCSNLDPFKFKLNLSESDSEESNTEVVKEKVQQNETAKNAAGIHTLARIQNSPSNFDASTGKKKIRKIKSNEGKNLNSMVSMEENATNRPGLDFNLSDSDEKEADNTLSKNAIILSGNNAHADTSKNLFCKTLDKKPHYVVSMKRNTIQPFSDFSSSDSEAEEIDTTLAKNCSSQINSKSLFDYFLEVPLMTPNSNCVDTISSISEEQELPKNNDIHLLDNNRCETLKSNESGESNQEELPIEDHQMNGKSSVCNDTKLKKVLDLKVVGKTTEKQRSKIDRFIPNASHHEALCSTTLSIADKNEEKNLKTSNLVSPEKTLKVNENKLVKTDNAHNDTGKSLFCKAIDQKPNSTLSMEENATNNLGFDYTLSDSDEEEADNALSTTANVLSDNNDTSKNLFCKTLDKKPHSVVSMKRNTLKQTVSDFSSSDSEEKEVDTALPKNRSSQMNSKSLFDCFLELSLMTPNSNCVHTTSSISQEEELPKNNDIHLLDNNRCQKDVQMSDGKSNKGKLPIEDHKIKNESRVCNDTKLKEMLDPEVIGQTEEHSKIDHFNSNALHHEVLCSTTLSIADKNEEKNLETSNLVSHEKTVEVNKLVKTDNAHNDTDKSLFCKAINQKPNSILSIEESATNSSGFDYNLSDSDEEESDNALSTNANVLSDNNDTSKNLFCKTFDKNPHSVVSMKKTTLKQPFSDFSSSDSEAEEVDTALAKNRSSQMNSKSLFDYFFEVPLKTPNSLPIENNQINGESSVCNDTKLKEMLDPKVIGQTEKQSQIDRFIPNASQREVLCSRTLSIADKSEEKYLKTSNSVFHEKTVEVNKNKLAETIRTDVRCESGLVGPPKIFHRGKNLTDKANGPRINLNYEELPGLGIKTVYRLPTEVTKKSIKRKTSMMERNPKKVKLDH